MVNNCLLADTGSTTPVTAYSRTRPIAVIQETTKLLCLLQGQLADQWAIDSEVLVQKLSEANAKVQTRIRNIRNKVNVADNAIKIIDQIDDALAFLKTVVVETL